MTTGSCPIVGYMFPSASQEGYDFDPAALAAELAEMEADPETEDYEDSFDFYNSMPEWELVGLYASRVS